MFLEDLNDDLENSSYSEDFELEEDTDEAPDMTGMVFSEPDDDKPIEKIELDTPAEQITIVDSMPEEVKEAITKFNARTAKLSNFMKDLKEEQEQEETNSNLEDLDSEEFSDELEDDNESLESEINNDSVADVEDLEDFL